MVKELLQEAQLLLEDRASATQKHTEDCWNGHENDNLSCNDLQMYFKVIKSGTNQKLVYDFLLVVYSNFCRITHPQRFWEILEDLLWAEMTSEIKDSMLIDDGNNETLEDAVECGGQTIIVTRSSAIAGRPCDAKACQGLLKWTWKWLPKLKWPSNVLQGHQNWHQSKASVCMISISGL